MKNTLFDKIPGIAASITLLALPVHAQITGNLNTTSVSYGNPLAIQTISTGFGDAAGGNDSAGGSELDAAYGTISGGDLYLFLAGNVENNGNHWNIFVSGGAPGQNTLALPATGTMGTMNGSVFSPNFQATWAYDMNDYEGTLYSEEYIYSGPGSLAGGYVGSVPESSTGIGAGTPSGGGYPAYTSLALNNNHASTMGASGTAYSGGAAVTTGLELQIPLAVIGYTGGNIMVLADVNGGGDSYLSNQFLPGLPVGTGNLETSTFNFSTAPGEYFTVPVPEPSTLALMSLSGLGALFAFRRKR